MDIKMEELVKEVRDLVKKEREKPNTALVVFAVIGIIALCVLGIYIVYRFIRPSYFEDYDDNVYDDEYDDEDEDSEKDA